MLHHVFLLKMAKIKKNPGLNANILEMKQRAQRGMTILILTFIRNMPAKTLTF